jgi:hypothetical protein
MKKKLNFIFLAAMIMIIAGTTVSCASKPPVPIYPEEPLGDLLRLVQGLWNDYIPPVKDPISSKQITYKFEGDVWYKQLDSKDDSAGKMVFEEKNPGEYIFTMKQTHTWQEPKKVLFFTVGGWVKTKEVNVMTLEYSKDAAPPLKIKL